jgi:Phosphate transport regulator (distant homolog of PhoU)
MKFRFKLKSSPNFFELLIRQSEIMKKGMGLLHDYCETHSEATADAVIKAETDGDMVRRVLIDELNKTFITPIDREDLFRLSSQLDEILDYAKTSVDEIRFFNVVPDDEMIDVTAALLDMCEHIILAVSNIENHQAIARDEAIYVKGMENKVGDMTTRALALLFENDDHKKIFKYREIYRHLNQTADIADEAMDTLMDIMVKMQ